jgi:hypothetical protein
MRVGGQSKAGAKNEGEAKRGRPGTGEGKEKMGKGATDFGTNVPVNPPK